MITNNSDNITNKATKYIRLYNTKIKNIYKDKYMKYRLTHKIQTKAQHRPTAPLIRPSDSTFST